MRVYPATELLNKYQFVEKVGALIEKKRFGSVSG
jgi:hypothetical protein